MKNLQVDSSLAFQVKSNNFRKFKLIATVHYRNFDFVHKNVCDSFNFEMPSVEKKMYYAF